MVKSNNQFCLSSPDKPGYQWDFFETLTVPTPTYLLAFLVADYQATTADPALNVSRIPFRVWTRPSYADRTA